MVNGSKPLAVWPTLLLPPGDQGSKAGQARPGAPDGVKQCKQCGKEAAGVSSAPQVTRAGAKASLEEPGAGKHSAKWDRCVQHVKAKGGAANPYAVCTTSVGQQAEDIVGGVKKNFDLPGVYQSIQKPKAAVPKRPLGKAPVAGQKQSARKHGTMNFIGRFKEASAAADGQPGQRFRVTMLQEGMGNFKDAFYYTADAIKSAVPLYEGRQFFIDHPDDIEEQTRPERSVRDLGGYFENVAAETAEDGRSVLTGDLRILPDESLNLFRAQMLESIQYAERHPGEDLVGLSINASGDFDTIPIQEFLDSFSIPDVCREKVIQAMQEGAQVIRPVREMTSAVSCDLVTVAGAGGQINKLLERGKKMAKQEAHQEEAHQEEAHQEEEAMAPGADGGDAATPMGDHPDEEQDIELIKSMLQKYLGDGFSDDDHQMMAQHLQAAKEMGLEGKEAEEVAGHSMKMAKHLLGKQAHQEADGEPAGAAVGVHGASTVPSASAKAPIGKGDQKPQEERGVHESARGKGVGVTQLIAQVARLQQELETMRLEKATDKALMESGLPRRVTQKFRESVLPSIRNTKQLQAELTKFTEAYKLGSATEGTGFIYGAEKQGGLDSVGGLADFSDCVTE